MGILIVRLFVSKTQSKGYVCMSTLYCNSITCASNAHNKCCRPAIKVQGQSAMRASDTRCQSFAEIGSSVDNLDGTFKRPNDVIEIHCTAEKCMYNNQHVCSADEIQIAGATAKRMSETECATFTER